jgi:hypothetical protein
VCGVLSVKKKKKNAISKITHTHTLYIIYMRDRDGIEN